MRAGQLVCEDVPVHTWLPLLAPFAAACLLLLAPGFVLAVAAGRRGVDALLLAPVLSTTVLALSAIVGGFTPWRWSAWMVLVGTAAGCALVLGTRFLARRLGRRLLHRRAVPARASLASEVRGERTGSTRADTVVVARWLSWDTAWPVLGVLVGALLWARHLHNILSSPDVISQTFDNLFHLSAIRFIMDRGSASSLTLSALNAGPGDSQFYPAAWHGYVSLITEITGTEIPIASNAMLCATVLVWVLSCQYLVRCMLPTTPLTVGATAVLSASFTAFPGIAMSFGVLYPNLLGLALAPALIGLGIQLLRVAAVVRYSLPEAFGLLVLATPGVALAHPNAVMTVVVFATAAIIVRCILTVRAAVLRRIAWWWGVVAAVAPFVYLVVVDHLWQTLRPPLSQLRWEPFTSLTDSLGQFLVNAPVGLWPAWLVSGLAIAGAYRTFRRRENLWLPLAGILLGYCWMIIASQPYDDWRIHITGVWYTDPFRVAMVLPLASLPLALAGVLQAVDVLTARSWRRGVPSLAVAAVVTVLLVALTQRAGYMNNSIEGIRNTYAQNDDSPLLDTDERLLLERLPEEIAPDAVVATDPWNGSSLAYALEGVRTTNHHALAYISPDAKILQESLDEAATDPTVCPAVERLDVQYALDFGDQNVNNAPDVYPGFDDLAQAQGFTLVDQQGDAKLYRVDACHVG